MLSSLLHHADDDPQTARLHAEGGRAYVSLSLRPFLIAALLDRDPAKPAIVVAGDDRQAREMAGSLRAWLAPRRVRYYPSRGVTYESHLAPPAHLQSVNGSPRSTRLLDDQSRPCERCRPVVVVVSAVALSEKVPDPSLRPHGFTLRKGELLDLDETADDLVAAGYERVDQVEDRGQFAIRGGLLDVFPSTEDRAVRVDLFGDEIESLRWFSTFTQRSLGDADEVEVAPAAELAAEYRELAEIAALEKEEERPDITELLPVEDFKTFLELIDAEAGVLLAAEEEVPPALTDNWHDVCAAFHDSEAHQLYVKPEAIAAELDTRARIRLSSIDQDQPFQFRGQAAEVGARNIRDAEPELEKLTRSGYRTVVTFAVKGEGDRAAYNLGRLKVGWLGDDGDQARSPSAEKALTFAHARLREGFIAPQFHLAVIPEHRLFRRRRAPEGPVRVGRRGALRSFAELRTGDFVVHEDHGVARFAGFDTKTVAGVTRDYLNLEYAGSDRVFMPVEQLAKISRYVGGGGEHGRRCRSSAARAGTRSRPVRGARLRIWPASCSTSMRSASVARAIRSRWTPSGSRSSRVPSNTRRCA